MSFEPFWASPPGDTISDLMVKRSISRAHLARELRLEPTRLDSLLTGGASIGHDLATKLEQTFGVSSAFWLARQRNYEEDLERIGPSDSAELRAWSKEVPVRQLINMGWLSEGASRAATIEACLRFFEVPNVKCFNIKYSDILTSAYFRTSPAYSQVPAAVCAWLRKGEIESDRIGCSPWDSGGFLDCLSNIRKLSRFSNPGKFIPPLQEMCAAVGVAVVIVRSPEGCRASGAAYRVANDKMVIQLSFRYLTDDHFWFSFFHEAGHLILHRERSLFLEGLPDDEFEYENEANQFADSVLLPPMARAQMCALPRNMIAVAKFAKKIGISAGIVVGQMQHAGLIPRSHMNRLKARFTWA